MSEQMPTIRPLEVQLVEEVRSCRSCQWFWGGTPPYGPYPSFDWKEKFPEHFRKSNAWEMGQKTSPLMEVQVNGQKLVAPAIMHGCRKAPIMTMGINPNLTSYFQGTTGARWAYPDFTDIANYAYYYRFQTIYQESFDLQFIREKSIADTKIIAEDDGWLLGVERSLSHRWMEITVRYKNEGKNRKIEAAWTDRARAVVLVEKKDPDRDPLSFRKGDVLAAKLDVPENVQAMLYENTTGYYQRFIPILEHLSAHITKNQPPGGAISPEVRLRLGEDVAQHDMISCASPGWGDKYDIPCDSITRKCVGEKRFAISQLLQSRPAVLVLVGGSTLKMFGEYFGDAIDLDYADKDIYQLLKETCTRKKYLTIETGGFRLKTRLIACPHFSYYQNYLCQSRFSAEAWTAFTKDFPDDAAILRKADRINDKGYDEVTALEIKGSNDPIRKDLSVAAWSVIMAYYFDPYRMIAGALIDEYADGNLRLDNSRQRLERTDGPCGFCDNSLWRFPQSCLYGKQDTTPYESGYLSNIVDKILS